MMTKPEIPSRQDGAILHARVANHSVGFGSSCPLTELVITYNNKPLVVTVHCTSLMKFTASNLVVSLLINTVMHRPSITVSLCKRKGVYLKGKIILIVSHYNNSQVPRSTSQCSGCENSTLNLNVNLILKTKCMDAHNLEPFTSSTEN